MMNTEKYFIVLMTNRMLDTVAKEKREVSEKLGMTSDYHSIPDNNKLHRSRLLPLAIHPAPKPEYIIYTEHLIVYIRVYMLYAIVDEIYLELVDS